MNLFLKVHKIFNSFTGFEFTFVSAQCVLQLYTCTILRNIPYMVSYALLSLQVLLYNNRYFEYSTVNNSRLHHYYITITCLHHYHVFTYITCL